MKKAMLIILALCLPSTAYSELVIGVVFSSGLQSSSEIRSIERNIAYTLDKLDIPAKVIFRDDQCYAQQAIYVAEHLFSENVNLVIGHPGCGTAEDVAKFYENFGILFFSLSDYSGSYRERYSNTFRLTVSSEDVDRYMNFIIEEAFPNDEIETLDYCEDQLSRDLRLQSSWVETTYINNYAFCHFDSALDIPDMQRISDSQILYYKQKDLTTLEATEDIARELDNPTNTSILIYAALEAWSNVATRNNNWQIDFDDFRNSTHKTIIGDLTFTPRGDISPAMAGVAEICDKNQCPRSCRNNCDNNYCCEVTSNQPLEYLDR